MKSVMALLTLTAVLLTAGPALAHSFDTILLVPVSGPQAAAGKQIRDGFAFAARERDGHPGEAADGHLGGLDVYFRLVDISAAADVPAARVAELVRRSADDRPWVVGPADMLTAMEDRIADVEWLPLDLAAPPPADLRTMDGRPFAAAFEEAFGYAPTPAVFAGYAAARQIDVTVRARN